MVAVGKISVDMVAYTGKLLKPVKQAQSAVVSFSKTASRVGIALGAIAAPIAAAVAGFLTFRKAVSEVGDAMERIDETGKRAERLGIPIEMLTGLEHAAGLADMSVEELGTSLQYMMKKGLAVGDLGRISDELKGIEDPVVRMQRVLEIFGRGGAGMVNVLAGGSAALEAMMKDAGALGKTFSQLDFKRVEAANDAITRMKGAWEGITNMAAIAFAPMIESIANWATQAVQWVKGFADNFQENIGILSQWWKDNWSNILKDLGDNFGTYIRNQLRLWEFMIRAMSRMFLVFEGWLSTNWKEAFSVGLKTGALSGMKSLVDMGGPILKVLSAFGKNARRALSGEDVSVEEMAGVNQMLDDLERGAQSVGLEGLMESLGTTLAEEIARGAEGIEQYKWTNTPAPQFKTDIKAPGIKIEWTAEKVAQALMGTGAFGFLNPFVLQKMMADTWEPIKRTIVGGEMGLGELGAAFSRPVEQWEDVRVGAVERGSQEAFSAILGTQKKVEEQHFAEAQRQTELLQAIAATKFTLAVTALAR